MASDREQSPENVRLVARVWRSVFRGPVLPASDRDRKESTVRWQQWRIHLMNVHLTDHNPSLGGYMGYRNETAGYPIIFNIEADPREMRNIAFENTWVVRPMTKIIGAYMATLKNHPNPPAANITVW